MPIQGNFFTERHIPELADILAKYSSKWNHRWNQIGISFGLPSNVLENILQTCFHSPELCIANVVSEWVCRKHENAKPPTLENLRKALCSNMVKLGDVANKLEKLLDEHGIHLDCDPLPFAKRRILWN